MDSLDAPATTSTSALTAYPTTPFYSSDQEWITAYLDIHVLSDESMVYAYIFWLALAVIIAVYSMLHLARLRGGYIGALWSKWSLRRRTWRKKHTLRVAQRNGEPHRQPYSLPSNAQLLTLTVLAIATLLVSFAGPDYFAPGAMLWNVNKSPSSSLASRATYNASTFAQYVPKYTIPKAWWTSGNRTGLIAFALFPLCVAVALKAPPFAVFALPFVLQLHFDKLAFIHRWSGRLIWFFTFLHVVLWSVQLLVERRNSTGKVVYTYAWEYQNFIYGWIAFGVMTLLVVLSFRPIRQAHYEAFYFLHVLLIPLTLIMSALHHPPVWWWCWAALALWVGERLYRLIWYLYANGFFGGMRAYPSQNKLYKTYSRSIPVKPEAWQMKEISNPKRLKPRPSIDSPASQPTPSTPTLRVDVFPSVSTSEQGSSQMVASFSAGRYVPPPGYALVELLPGRTVRLRLITPGYLPWAPGQHFLLRVPAISRFTSHPFTSASVCDAQTGSGGRELVFLVRAKNGWTKDLWDMAALCAARGLSCAPGERLPRGEVPVRGVLMRAHVDGPYGSAARARWEDYQSVMLVAGGSGGGMGGIWVGTAEAGGNPASGPGGSDLSGSYASLLPGHIQWCASLLRQCMAMVPPSELQVDIFVTNIKPSPITQPQPKPSLSALKQSSPSSESLTPPAPRFARESRRPERQQSHAHVRSDSVSSTDDSDAENDSFVDLSYYTGDYVEDRGELGHEEHVLDLTNFEGDDDTALPGETQFNAQVKREGKLRRANTKRRSAVISAKQELEDRVEGQIHRDRPSTQLMSGKKLEPVDESYHPDSSPSKFDTNMYSPSSSRTPTSAVPLLGESSKLPFSQASPDVPGSLNPVGPASPPGPPTTISRPASSYSQMSGWSEVHSLAALVSEGEAGRSGEQLRLEHDEQELQDVGIVAEHARPGKPKLDRILADEVERAKGPIIVGCCGPTSLNAVMRKAVAAQISPERIRHGDMRGSIAFVSEDFEY
ncbi:hypothetical protein AcW1_005733 [Taiwanofungus camphoratus]|nr:hypothetical protein AcV7_009012 [Antrodia cinnamomea]KAI0957298.1 hypothetical protein AcW1_005733 [Antrodia cinnamomea]